MSNTEAYWLIWFGAVLGMALWFGIFAAIHGFQVWRDSRMRARMERRYVVQLPARPRVRVRHNSIPRRWE